MFKIENIVIKNKVVLAPMAGITSSGYRKFMSQFKPGYMVTEMISDMGLIYGNKETIDYVKFEKTDIPVGVQLFGNCSENMAKAALICEKINPNIDFYDVNMGCPVAKVTSNGSGSALMKNPKLCGDIVRAIKEATHKPVTVKIRLGYTPSTMNFMEVIEEVTKAGASLIAIHPRTAKDMYRGIPNWEAVRDLKKKIDVPLIVSGNLYTVEDVINALEITGADGVMIARGGVGNPRLLENLNKYFVGKEYEKPTLDEQIQYCLELARDLIEEKGEKVAMRVYRGISVKFFEGFPHSKTLKCRLSTELNSYQDLIRLLEEYKQEISI